MELQNDTNSNNNKNAVLVTLKVGNIAGQMQMAVDDVEQFLGCRNPAGVQLGPDGHIVKGDLECTG